MRPFLPSVALLTAVFVLGCREQASSPVGPDTEIIGPNFDPFPHAPPGHGGGGDENGDEATFTAIFQALGGPGDCDPVAGGNQACDVISGNIGPLVRNPGLHTDPGSPAALNLAFFQAAVTDGYTAAEGGNCFAGNPFTGPLRIDFNKNNPINASITFDFTAKDKDGITDVNYQLGLRGLITDPDDWPPAITNTITGESFNMHIGTGPRKIACTGTGLLNFSMVVTRN